MILSLVAVTGASAVAEHHEGGDDALVEMERTLWQAWKDGDTEPFEQHLAEGGINIVPGGITVGRAEQVADLAEGACEVASYELGEVTVHRPSTGVAILTYSASQDATCYGTKIPAKIVVSSVWVEQEGAWKSVLYHESVPAD
jgi:hypothetical protein